MCFQLFIDLLNCDCDHKSAVKLLQATSPAQEDVCLLSLSILDEMNKCMTELAGREVMSFCCGRVVIEIHCRYVHCFNVQSICCRYAFVHGVCSHCEQFHVLVAPICASEMLRLSR